MKLSVILTSYNHQQYLKQSIESILNQTYNEFEFIIVDDCSTDASWEIICEYKQRYPQIIALRHEYNWGGGSVADVVKNYATGDYIALHHSDDVWEIDKLEKQLAVLETMPNCAAVFTCAQAIDEEGNDYLDEDGFYFNVFNVKNRSRYEWLNYFFYHGNCLCHPSILIKKDVYMEDDFFRKGLTQIPDMVKWIQVCKRHEIFIMPDKLVKFRVRKEGKNTSGMRGDTQIRSTVELFLMLQEYVQIKEREEFLKVFPEAEKYCLGGYFSTEYVFGRLCLEEGMPSYTRLFGVQLLYGVLNSAKDAEQIKKEYGYTAKQFAIENSKKDIFGILPAFYDQMRSIYFDIGSGIVSEDGFFESYFLNEKSHFKMVVHQKLPEGKKLKTVRFDPAEGIMVATTLINISINGQTLKDIKAENAFLHSENKDIFLNLDPIYLADIPIELQEAETLEIIIEGTVERLSNDYICELLTETMYRTRETIAANQELYHNALKDYEEVCRILDRERIDTQKLWDKTQEEYRQILTEKDQQLLQIQQALQAKEQQLQEKDQQLIRIKNTRWYRIWEKLPKFM